MEQNTQKTALLVMDMQLGILGAFAGAAQLINNVAAAIAAARAKAIPVIYVRVGFRQGAPEISTGNKIFTAYKTKLENLNMEQYMTIDPGVAPLESDVVVTKRRISAFTGSDLEVVLRAQCIQHIVLTGISTSGVMLSTVREAADKDYRITVLADCCNDADEEVHRVLTTKIFPRQADVMTGEEWGRG